MLLKITEGSTVPSAEGSILRHFIRQGVRPGGAAYATRSAAAVQRHAAREDGARRRGRAVLCDTHITSLTLTLSCCRTRACTWDPAVLTSVRKGATLWLATWSTSRVWLSQTSYGSQATQARSTRSTSRVSATSGTAAAGTGFSCSSSWRWRAALRIAKRGHAAGDWPVAALGPAADVARDLSGAPRPEGEEEGRRGGGPHPRAPCRPGPRVAPLRGRRCAWDGDDTPCLDRGSPGGAGPTCCSA